MSTIREIEAKWQAHMSNCQTATFGMGCFWSPDARFGALPGVIRTKTGFAGGTTEHPTYRQMGDHTETIQIEFDPDVLSFEEILSVFWRSHTSTNRTHYGERQYMSLLFYHNEEQRETIERVKQELESERNEPIETEIQPFSSFTPAEERHQKYHVKRFKRAADELSSSFDTPDSFTNSTLIARLNGFVKEYTTLSRIEEEIHLWDLSDSYKEELTAFIRRIRW
ncbi:peptide-methionine (S)-S-oxide reductase MsrA [Domibacillus robiginosus]|uniref:peptide-methionine (S)-S-oxide reductase MsrA n=1 Tax=Domibacillus robiginosus TaxID=1071054 RepID=UPI00067A8F8D|nr:peptide-methionine (S)-S-oxide reductase MsrA [Domibacillus robiginosus]